MYIILSSSFPKREATTTNRRRLFLLFLKLLQVGFDLLDLLFEFDVLGMKRGKLGVELINGTDAALVGV
jgi:hypothetical protein